MIGRRTVLAAVLTGLLALAAPASAQDVPRSVSNALIFDVVVDRVEQHYWNASGLGDEWQTRVRDLRPQAVAAPDETAL
jgi:hypothetical protein